MSKDLIDAIVEIRDQDSIRIAKELLDSGADPVSFIKDFRSACNLIGSRFSQERCLFLRFY
jgi:methanogenic corrinoid protein MtbC1